MSNDKQVITHTSAKLNVQASTPIQRLRNNLTNPEGAFIGSVLKYYSNNKIEALKFATAAVEYIRKTPKLMETDPVSLMAAFVQSAFFRFMPSGISGEAYIIPYGKEARFQIGYKGWVTLYYRTGKVSLITANIVYENDEFDFREGLNADLIHKPVFGKPKGKPIGVYTIFIMTDGVKSFKVLDRESVMAIKELSKAKDSKESPWNSDKDPELWMWKKTCVIQHGKLMPTTEEIQQALEKDFEGEGLDRGRLDPMGPAVGPAIHQPEAIEPPKEKTKQEEEMPEFDDEHQNDINY